MPKKMTLKEFIEKSIKIHGSVYNYSEVKYINSATKVDIKCLIHGVYQQSPNRHLSGNGCPKCGNIKGGLKNSMGQDVFISKCRKVHKDKYSYENTSYKSLKDKIKVTCKNHGIFIPSAENHLNGSGCPKCAIDNSKISFNEFVTMSNKKHNNEYIYNESFFNGFRELTKIYCKKHGYFKQTPSSHAKGSICFKCARINQGIRSIQKRIKQRYLNLVQPKDYKIIPLNKGNYTLVDNEDFDKLKDIIWKISAHGYVISDKGMIHRLIMNCPDDKVIDHKDSNPLNNRKSNLRICSQQQNLMNRPSNKNSSSKYKGVSWCNRLNKWRSRIGLNKKQTVIGYFHSEVEAAKAYDKEAIKLFGEFAYLNFK